MVSVSIRALRPDEKDLLLSATVDNFNWQSERFTSSEILASPDAVYYTELSPNRGDFGFVALHDDTPVGVAWALFLPASNPGWGFVDRETPEASVWVSEAFRRRGIGRALIHALQHGTRMRDYPGLSLSVAVGNPARDLYLEEGFVDVSQDETHHVMVWRR